MPYSGQNMRHVVFGVFSLGGLLSGAALIVLGINLFRNFGFWVLAVAVFVLVISATGFREGQRWAWYSLLYHAQRL